MIGTRRVLEFANRDVLGMDPGLYMKFICTYYTQLEGILYYFF